MTIEKQTTKPAVPICKIVLLPILENARIAKRDRLSWIALIINMDSLSKLRKLKLKLVPLSCRRNAR